MRVARVSWPAGLLAIFASIQKGSIPLLSAEDTLRLTCQARVKHMSLCTSIFCHEKCHEQSAPELGLFPLSRSKSQESPVGDDGTHLELRSSELHGTHSDSQTIDPAFKRALGTEHFGCQKGRPLQCGARKQDKQDNQFARKSSYLSILASYGHSTTLKSLQIVHSHVSCFSFPPVPVHQRKDR